MIKYKLFPQVAETGWMRKELRFKHAWGAMAGGALVGWVYRGQ